jgi:hypothetical protein
MDYDHRSDRLELRGRDAASGSAYASASWSVSPGPPSSPWADASVHLVSACAVARVELNGKPFRVASAATAGASFSSALLIVTSRFIVVGWARRNAASTPSRWSAPSGYHAA